MTSRFEWAILFVVSIMILFFFVVSPPQHAAGDIVEYLGITESLKNHLSVNLTLEDQKNLEKNLSPAYFSDPQYYINTGNNMRFPVHFIFYSIMLFPIRLMLDFFNFHPFLVFPITNIIIISATLIYIFKQYLSNSLSRMSLIILVFLSPLLSFVNWYGPDILVTMLILFSLFSYFNKNIDLAVYLMIIASWHSQPLGLIALFGILKIFFSSFDSFFKKPANIINIVILILLLLLPYVYNFIIFKTITPWSIIQNGWTQLNGFGFQNLSLKKLYEQFFDFNMGLFWYAPVLCLMGLAGIILAWKKNNQLGCISVLFLLTAFLYQTNPAWHYGTAGYGPTRHIIFFLPLLIFTSLFLTNHIKIFITFLSIYIVTQCFILSTNGFMMPDHTKSLYHNNLAEYILKNYPEFYNPTPQIFIDRTNHTNLQSSTGSTKFITSAIYKYNDVCRKAYILPSDIDLLIKECGFIPTKYQNKINTLYLNNWYEGIYITY